MTNWDFDELDELEAKFSQADNPKIPAQDGGAPSNGAHNTTKEVPKTQPTVENCKRLLSGSWQQVLGVTQLDAAEVKKAYRELALLHHPDKGGSDGDFKLLRRAYEDGLIAVKRKEEAAYKPKPGAQLVEVEERQWPLHPAAAKVRVRGAVDQWEHDYDLGQVSSVPDDIPEISSEELAQWLLKGAAVALDCRELIEAKYERRTPVVPGGITMSFGDLRSAPDLLSRHLVRLVDSDCQVVTFSTRGGTSGNCGMCAALLIDVFGMKASRFWRLEGGLDDWFAWAAQNPDIIRALPERSAIEL